MIEIFLIFKKNKKLKCLPWTGWNGRIWTRWPWLLWALLDLFLNHLDRFKVTWKKMVICQEWKYSYRTCQHSARGKMRRKNKQKVSECDVFVVSRVAFWPSCPGLSRTQSCLIQFLENRDLYFCSLVLKYKKNSIWKNKKNTNCSKNGLIFELKFIHYYNYRLTILIFN